MIRAPWSAVRSVAASGEFRFELHFEEVAKSVLIRSNMMQVDAIEASLSEFFDRLQSLLNVIPQNESIW